MSLHNFQVPTTHLSRIWPILGDPWATSRDDAIFSARKFTSRAEEPLGTNLRYTFDKSAEKIDGRVLLPSSNVTVCNVLGFVKSLFLKFFMGIFPLHGPSNLIDRWRKPLRVRRQQNYPARPPRWLARIISISGTDFANFWNSFGNKKFFRSWSKLLRWKYRIVSTSSPWISEDVFDRTTLNDLCVNSMVCNCAYDGRTWSMAFFFVFQRHRNSPTKQ